MSRVCPLVTCVTPAPANRDIAVERVGARSLLTSREYLGPWCVAPEGAPLNDPPSKMQDGAQSRLRPLAGRTL